LKEADLLSGGWIQMKKIKRQWPLEIEDEIHRIETNDGQS
jgi:hypothetical protein